MDINDVSILMNDPYLFITLLFYILSFLLIKSYYYKYEKRKEKLRKNNNIYLTFSFLILLSIIISFLFLIIEKLFFNLLFEKKFFSILVLFSSFFTFLMAYLINLNISYFINKHKSIFYIISIIILIISFLLLMNCKNKFILQILTGFFLITIIYLFSYLSIKRNEIFTILIFSLIILTIPFFNIKSQISKIAIYVYPYNISQIKSSTICNKTGNYPFNMTIYNSYDKYVVLSDIKITYKSYNPLYRLKPLMIPPHSEITISENNSSLFIRGEKNYLVFDCEKLSSDTTIHIFTSEGTFSYRFPNQKFILNNTS